MEQRGVLLRGIAGGLNAAGSALLNIYDAATSILTVVLPGEKGNMTAQLREYEKKIERLYCEIGKEVALHAESAGLSAAAEAATKRAAEYQAEIEKIRHRIQNIEAEAEVAASSRRQAAKDSAAAEVKTAAETPIEETNEIAAAVPAPDIAPEAAEFVEPSAVAQSADNALEESADMLVEVVEAASPEIVPDAAESVEPEIAEGSTDNTPEKSADMVEAAETPKQELQKEMAESEAPSAAETFPAAETEEAAAVELESLTKSDLLQLCREKGIEADKKMTKGDIIALLAGC
jgi:hypothetical protein